MSHEILFHTPQSITDDIDSGSKVRPKKMAEAFRELGFDITYITGTTSDRRARLRAVTQKKTTYAFCYSEPTSWPLNPFVDYPLYRYIWSKGIPMGVFYRDAYWKLPDTNDFSGLKHLELQLRYRSDLAILKRVANKMYFPTKSFQDFLDVTIDVDPLPPGADEGYISKTSKQSADRVIYVGGVSDRYGTDLLAESFEILGEETDIHLDLVCRKAELEQLPKAVRLQLDSDWVTLHHCSGDDLVPLYREADIGIVPLRPTQYNNMAMPVKLFEYMAHGLPIVATDCDEIASFVQTYACGIVTDPDPASLASGVMSLCSDESFFQTKQDNVLTAVKENRWKDRASTVADELAQI